MKSFDQIKKENGSCIIEGVEYALIQQAYADEYFGDFVFTATAVTRENYTDGFDAFDPLFDEVITLVWDCPDCEDPENLIDWENDGYII